MALTLTFLGKGGTGRSTIAIATAKKYAAEGKRVLFVGQEPTPALNWLLGAELGPEPTEIAPNLKAVSMEATVLLERGWEELKKLEAQYLRTPFFKDVYGQELGIVPGIEEALTLNSLRLYDASGEYDLVIYDGTGDKAMVRLLGAAEITSWYFRRFRQVILDSDLYKSLSPFFQPISSAIMNVDWTNNDFAQPTGEINNLLDKARDAIADPTRVVTYLVTNDDPVAIATARFLWGTAQQANLTVGGAILNQGEVTGAIAEKFAPLSITSLPKMTGDNWQPLMDALPSFSEAVKAPRPITIDLAKRQVSLFLPGFDKKDIKLTQYGPEVTIEAGDQRRNIFLPPELKGKPVTGAKFQNSYLIISFG
jgi:arsenite-transporting ATPase